jgi:hypothetical protein
VLPDDRRPLSPPTRKCSRRSTGRSTAWWTAWPATRGAKAAWSIAATTPSGALGTNYQRGDNWKNFKYNFGTRPAPHPEGAKVQAFNGFSVGKGHLAEAKAAVNRELSGAKSAFARGGNDIPAGNFPGRRRLRLDRGHPRPPTARSGPSCSPRSGKTARSLSLPRVSGCQRTLPTSPGRGRSHGSSRHSV